VVVHGQVGGGQVVGGV